MAGANISGRSLFYHRGLKHSYLEQLNSQAGNFRGHARQEARVAGCPKIAGDKPASPVGFPD